MSEEIKLAKSNTDSGRMADHALRQKFDERTQLRERDTGEVLRDHTADAMNGVETDEHRQMEVVRFDSYEEPQSEPRWSERPNYAPYSSDPPSYREAPASPSGQLPEPVRVADEEKTSNEVPVERRGEPASAENRESGSRNTSIETNRGQSASYEAFEGQSVPFSPYQARQGDFASREQPQYAPDLQSDAAFRYQPSAILPFSRFDTADQPEQVAANSPVPLDQRGTVQARSESNRVQSTSYKAYEGQPVLFTPYQSRQGDSTSTEQPRYEPYLQAGAEFQHQPDSFHLPSQSEAVNQSEQIAANRPAPPDQRGTVQGRSKSEEFQDRSSQRFIVQRDTGAPSRGVSHIQQESRSGDSGAEGSFPLSRYEEPPRIAPLGYPQERQSGSGEYAPPVLPLGEGILDEQEHLIPPVPRPAEVREAQGRSVSRSNVESRSGERGALSQMSRSDTKPEAVTSKGKSTLNGNTPLPENSPSGRSTARLAADNAQSPEALLQLAKKEAEKKAALDPIAPKPQSRLDRMLKSDSSRQMNPETALRSSEVSTASLGKGNPNVNDLPLKSHSRGLKRYTALRLLAGAAVSTAAVTGRLSSLHGDGETDRDARSVTDSYRQGALRTRSLYQAAREHQRRQIEKRAAQEGRAAASAAGKAAGETAKKGAATLMEGLKDASAEIMAAAGEVIVPAAVVILSALLIVLIVMSIVTSTAGSPYGIFFVHEQKQEIEFGTAISQITNSYYNRIFSQQMSNDCESIEVICNLSDSEQIWKEITAVYAVEVCKEGMDAMTMDADHYEILKDVFWQKINISFYTTTWTERVETVVQEAYSYTITHYYDPDGNPSSVLVPGGSSSTETVNVPAVVEVSYVTHRILHVTVMEKPLEQVENHYHFNDGDKKTVDDLLAESDDLWAELTADFTNLIISSDGAIGTVDVTSYATVAETIYRALIEHGYSKQAACGILGNIQQECTMNPNCWSGGAYGLCQWMGGRLANLQRLSGWQTAEVQTGFMLSELSHSTGIWTTYGGEVGHTYHGVHITSLSAFKSCTNVKAAAGAFCICFERSGEFPGNQWYEARLSYAQQWYNYAQAHWNDGT